MNEANDLFHPYILNVKVKIYSQILILHFFKK